MQQLYVKGIEQQSGEKKGDDTVTDVPKTGDTVDPFPIAAAAAGAGGGHSDSDRMYTKKT